jgi:hypothetical protein
LIVGGDILNYFGDVATSTADITTFKILINSTLSTEDATMMMMDIKNYYLGTPLPRFEYMKMLLSRFPEEIVQKYHLNALAVDGWVYIEIRKGMYGLKQAGLLINQLLQTRLAPFGYYPARHTPGIWLHHTRPISFTLVVDDFAVKYVGKQHAEHLRNALLKTYELTTDWDGTVYSGITLKWDYKNRTRDISMPGYVSNVLRKFQRDAPKHPQHTPSRYVTPVYGTKTCQCNHFGFGSQLSRPTTPKVGFKKIAKEPVINDKDWPRTLETIREYIASQYGVTGAILDYVVRPDIEVKR